VSLQSEELIAGDKNAQQSSTSLERRGQALRDL
jgi:hypothetical protein